jgi:hypothetical protein
MGLRRKHAIKLLGAETGCGGDPDVRKGRPPKYNGEVEQVLWRILKVSEQPCGKMLKALMPQWPPHYEDEYGRLGKDLRSRVLSISAAQIDRLLAARKTRVGHRGRCGTKPGGFSKRRSRSGRTTALSPSTGTCCATFKSCRRRWGSPRSRPYKKDDNGHVEQKNWTHVRQLLGSDRIGDPELVEPINAL